MRHFQIVQNKLMRTGSDDGRARDKISVDRRPTTIFFFCTYSIESILTDARRTTTKALSIK